MSRQHAAGLWKTPSPASLNPVLEIDAGPRQHTLAVIALHLAAADALSVGGPGRAWRALSAGVASRTSNPPRQWVWPSRAKANQAGFFVPLGRRRPVYISGWNWSWPAFTSTRRYHISSLICG